MLKDDVKKDSRIKKKTKQNKQKVKLDKSKDKMRSLHIFNNTIDITLPSPNKARDT